MRTLHPGISCRRKNAVADAGQIGHDEIPRPARCRTCPLPRVALMRMRLVCLVGLWLLPARAWADDLPTDVAALLQQRCGECHGDTTQKSGLQLTTATGIARGGRKGPVVVPGKPEASRLWEMVAGGKMPPKKTLSEPER